MLEVTKNKLFQLIFDETHNEKKLTQAERDLIKDIYETDPKGVDEIYSEVDAHFDDDSIDG